MREQREQGRREEAAGVPRGGGVGHGGPHFWCKGLVAHVAQTEPGGGGGLPQLQLLAAARALRTSHPPPRWLLLLCCCFQARSSAAHPCTTRQQGEAGLVMLRAGGLPATRTHVRVYGRKPASTPAHLHHAPNCSFTVDAGGVTWAYRQSQPKEADASKLKVLLLHGLGSSSYSYRCALALLRAIQHASSACCNACFAAAASHQAAVCCVHHPAVQAHACDARRCRL